MYHVTAIKALAQSRTAPCHSIHVLNLVFTHQQPVGHDLSLGTRQNLTSPCQAWPACKCWQYY
jgi:hypothetical protein